MEGKYKDIHKVKLEEVDTEDEQSFKVHCPSCKLVIPAENMNIVDKIAKCNSCDSLFPLNLQKLITKSNSIQALVERPSNVSIMHEGASKEIEIRDKKGIKGFLSILYMISALFLLVLYKEGFTEVAVTLNVIAWSFTLWYTYIYRSLTQKIIIEIDGHFLTMEYVPWFFTRKKEIDVDTIKNVYIQKVGDPYGMGNEYHQVRLRIDRGEGVEEIKLMPWTYQSLQEATYIKQEIESYLV
jgi:hypothetical protein